MKFEFYADASPTPPPRPANPSVGYPSNGDPSTGRAPTTPGAWFFYMLMVEFETLLKQNGIEPSAENLHQLADFFAQYKAFVLDAVNRANASAESILPILANAKNYAERAEAAEKAAKQSAEKLDVVEEHYPAFLRALEEVTELFSSLDEVQLSVLNTAAVSHSSLTRNELQKYARWQDSGLSKLKRLGEASLLTRRQNESALWAFDDDVRMKRLLLRTYVEKPYLLFIVAGQSNAVGTGPSPGYEDASYCGLYWDWKDQKSKSLKPLRDPVYRSVKGSAWPSFARKIFELTGRKTIILNIAWGGAAVTNINPSNSWYQDDEVVSLRRIDATREWTALLDALKASSIDYELAGMMWVQGESECAQIGAGTLSVQSYVDGTLDVFKYFRDLTSRPTLPIYMAQIGYTKSVLTNPVLLNGYEAVRAAQLELCMKNENDFMACELPGTYFRAGYMQDAIHYNQRGYNSLGASFARFISNHQSF